MTPSDSMTTLDHLASRLSEAHEELAREWLERLDALLTVERRTVFPTHQLLDHIPELIRQIADYLRAPESEEIAANTAVMAKASELGLLRFEQRASVHQLLREYQMFGEILEAFVAREVRRLDQRADAAAAVTALARATQAVRVLQQKTVDAFVARYTETVDRQTAQLRSFSRLISHEIRQPLGVLQVLPRLIPVDDGDGEAARLLRTLDRNVTRLGELATKLERLARLTHRTEGGPGEQRIDLTALARDVASQLSEMAEARDVQVDVDADLPHLVADAGRVELVLVNLMANAIKYSDPAKSPRLVRVERVDSSAAGGVRLRVRDNGLGIPAAKRDVIFNQFVRAHADRDDELGVQGLGLGLSIVRESMEMLEGAILVESVEGEGTSFTLAWPVRPLA